MTSTQRETTSAPGRGAASGRFSADEQQLMREEFALRLKIAFDNASNAEIARRLRTTDATVKLYVDAVRLPIFEILVEISRVTGINLNWLMTGRGPQRSMRSDELFSDEETQAIRELARRSGRTIEEQIKVLTLAAVELAGKV